LISHSIYKSPATAGTEIAMEALNFGSTYTPDTNTEELNDVDTGGDVDDTDAVGATSDQDDQVCTPCISSGSR
jgi:hypothetical protein